MIASAALQKAVFVALSGNITGTVHDEVPANTPAPYTVIGETTERPWDAHDSDGSEETLTIHLWSSTPGSTQVKTILAQIDALLHHQSLALDGAPYLVMLRREFVTVLKDESVTGETWRHGVMRYRALISE